MFGYKNDEGSKTVKLKNIIIQLANCLPLKKCILLESCPDLSDNTKSVFDEMMLRNLNSKYKIVWYVDKKSKSFPNYKNVIYLENSNRFVCSYYAIFSKALICCNRFIVPRHKEQISIYLSHGLPIKSLRNYYTMPNSIHYILSPSQKVSGIMSKEFNVPLNKVISLGYPRNDILVKPQIDINSLFGFEGKIIVWLPTFRQQKSGQKHGGAALPIIHDEKKAIELNYIAKKYNVLVVLKPHFAQDMTYINKHRLSNIKIINDNFLQKRNTTLYQLLSSCSALLTDYSSVYYDFTLCNKPIGVIWEDIEEYRKEPGFAVDLNHFLKGAEKIYSYNDFASFIEDVANGVDRLNDERNEIKNEVTFTDGLSSKRVVDFIEKLLD